eukprot:6908665-Pyramimonas_sp.AAC.1
MALMLWPLEAARQLAEVSLRQPSDPLATGCGVFETATSSPGIGTRPEAAFGGGARSNTLD